MSTHSPCLWKILSHAWKIITSNLLHFLILSALFILPLPVTSIVYQFLIPQPTSIYLQSLSSVPYSEKSTPNPIPQLLTPILITTLSTLLFSLCASPSITHSTFAAFHDKPVKLSSSLKTILDSFFPLLATLFAKQLILVLLFIVFFILLAVGFSVLVMSGLQIRNLSIIMYITMVILVMVVIYILIIKWFLSDAVVVLESNWGFAALKRSSYLVKGNRRVVLSMLSLSSALGGVLTVWSFNFVANAGKVSNVWTFAQIVVYVVFTAMFSLYGLVAGTVLYIYCKASHGETTRPTEAEYFLVPVE